MPLAIVDSHCHLDFEQFAGQIDEIIARARDNGVFLMVTISTRVKRFDQIRAIVEAHEEIWCTVGTHPHNAKEETDVTVDDLVRIAAHPKVVGIGEVGLDYHYDLSPRDIQAASFRTHIRAARETGLPLVIHSREAEDDTAEMLEEEMGKGAFKPLLHCFASKPELARRGLAIGAYVSFSGILTFKNATDIHEAARLTPLDRVLVETIRLIWRRCLIAARPTSRPIPATRWRNWRGARASHPTKRHEPLPPISSTSFIR